MISMVAAMSKNNVVGSGGHLPWGKTMPDDAKRYTDLIKGHTIIMGSSTYGEADHTRSDSKIVVLTRRDLELPEGIGIVHSAEDIKAMDRPEEEIFITGGGKVFQMMIEHADKIYLTVIDEQFDGDAHFPEVDETQWDLVEKEDFKKDDRNKYDYSFLTYERNK